MLPATAYGVCLLLCAAQFPGPVALGIVTGSPPLMVKSAASTSAGVSALRKCAEPSQDATLLVGAEHGAHAVPQESTELSLTQALPHR